MFQDPQTRQMNQFHFTFGRKFHPFFFKSSESDRFLSCIQRIRIRFFELGELIQNGLGTAQYVSRRLFVLSGKVKLLRSRQQCDSPRHLPPAYLRRVDLRISDTTPLGRIKVDEETASE